MGRPVLNHPELLSDIGDVVRMFDPCPVTLTQDRTGRVLVHEVKKEEDCWRQRAELWEEGRLTASNERSDPIPRRAPHPKAHFPPGGKALCLRSNEKGNGQDSALGIADRCAAGQALLGSGRGERTRGRSAHPSGNL